MKAVAQVLGVARSNLVEQPKPSVARQRRPRPDDEGLLPMVRAIVAERASYGYRRVTALLNRQLQAEGRPRIKHKQIYRIMQINQLVLPRYHGQRERSHDGVVITLRAICIGARTFSPSAAGRVALRCCSVSIAVTRR